MAFMLESDLTDLKLKELLNEVRVDYSKTQALEDAVTIIRDILLNISEEQIKTTGAAAFIKDLGVPDDKVNFKFRKPDSVEIIGSYAIKVVAKPVENVDLAVRMPKIWARQRSSISAPDCLNGFLASMILAHLTTEAGGQRINSLMTGLQIFRVVIDFFANSNNLEKGIFMKSKSVGIMPLERIGYNYAMIHETEKHFGYWWTVWECEQWEKHLIIKKIAEYILSRHLSLSTQDICIVADQLDFSLMEGGKGLSHGTLIGNVQNGNTTPPEKDLLLRSQHSSMLNGLHGVHPVYGPTVRLAKRWICSHLFSAVLADEAVELLVAYLFVRPFPFSAPQSQVTGFLRSSSELLTHLIGGEIHDRWEVNFPKYFDIWYDALGNEVMGLTWTREASFSKDAGHKRKRDELDSSCFDVRCILKEIGDVGEGLVKSLHLLNIPKDNK